MSRNLDCWHGHLSCSLLLHSLSLDLCRIKVSLFLSLFQLSCCVNLLILSCLGLHYLLIGALLGYGGSTHSVLLACRFVRLRSLAEEVLALWGQETASAKASLMILILAIDNPFTLEELLLSCEAT